MLQFKDWLNPLPNDKIVDLSKLKGFARKKILKNLNLFWEGYWLVGCIGV